MVVDHVDVTIIRVVFPLFQLDTQVVHHTHVQALEIMLGAAVMVRYVLNL